MAGGALLVEHVEKFYNSMQVLSDIQFDTAPGEFVSIVGTSGCGKTTLLRIISGLEPPSRGVIQVGGTTVDGPSLNVGIGFQNDRLMPWRTVAQNVGLGLEMRRRRAGPSSARVSEMLSLVGLTEFAQRYPYELSGGMRQRVNLARALAIDPDLLLLDEPFASLDAQTREVMQVELLRVWQETRKSILFITHQIDEAVYLSDRVIVLRRRPGRVREIVPIDLPRPRTLALKRTSEFNAYVDRIWRGLEADVEAAQRDVEAVKS